MARFDEREIERFEVELGAWFGVRNAVAVSSGTGALYCALAAVGVQSGDEVIVPALSVVMTVAPIVALGAIPIVVDSSPGRLGIDIEGVEDCITSRTKAMVPVHLWGYVQNMEGLVRCARSHGLAIVEDACQAHGSSCRGRWAGTWGDVGCFSMRQGKLMATGEGGFILTDDDLIADRCRLIRSHGFDGEDIESSYQHLSSNYRLAAPLARLGRRELAQLEGVLARQRCLGLILNGRLETLGIDAYQWDRDSHPNFYSLLALTSSSDGPEVCARLAAAGFPNSVATFGFRPLQDWAGLRRFGDRVTPNARNLVSRSVAPTLDQSLGEDGVDALANAISAAVGRRGHRADEHTNNSA